jgi:hypothetical protein
MCYAVGKRAQQWIALRDSMRALLQPNNIADRHEIEEDR